MAEAQSSGDGARSMSISRASARLPSSSTGAAGEAKEAGTGHAFVCLSPSQSAVSVYQVQPLRRLRDVGQLVQNLGTVGIAIMRDVRDDFLALSVLDESTTDYVQPSSCRAYVYCMSKKSIATKFIVSSPVLNMVMYQEYLAIATKNDVSIVTLPTQRHPSVLVAHCRSGPKALGVCAMAKVSYDGRNGTCRVAFELESQPGCLDTFIMKRKDDEENEDADADEDSNTGNSTGRAHVLDVMTDDGQTSKKEFDRYQLVRARQIPCFSNPLACIAFSQDGAMIASTCTRGTRIRVHIASTGTLHKEFHRGSVSAEMYCLSFCPQGKFLCASSSRGTVHIFSLSTDADKETGWTLGWLDGGSTRSFASFSLPAGVPSQCVFNASSSQVIAACADGSYHVHTFDTKGNCVRLADSPTSLDEVDD